eukprot:2344922-Alexandrium_andersonii.AAC.1
MPARHTHAPNNARAPPQARNKRALSAAHITDRQAGTQASRQASMHRERERQRQRQTDRQTD